MNTLQFLGLYSGTLDIATQKKDMGKTQYWFVWFLESDQKYIVCNKDEQKDLPLFSLSHYQFDKIFTIEERDFLEPPYPHQKDVHIYDSATKEDPFNSPRESAQDLSLQSQAQKKQNDTKNLAYLAPVKDEPSNNTSSQISTPSQATSSEKKRLELERQNKLASRLDNEILKTLAQIIELWKTDEKEAAIKRVELLLARHDTLVPAHKHTFTKCAIQLRKIQEWDLALKFALRCVEISPDDSHVYFNVARIYYEEQAYAQALEYSKKALDLEADMEAAQRLNAAICAALSK